MIATAAITTIAAIKIHPQTGISSYLLVLQGDTQTVSAETSISLCTPAGWRCAICPSDHRAGPMFEIGSTLREARMR
jgi:hypothetical protein